VIILIIRRKTAGAVCISAILTLTACGGGKAAKATNDELKQVVLALCDDLDTANGQIDALNAKVAAFQKAQVSENTVSIKSLNDGTNRTEFITEIYAENGENGENGESDAEETPESTPKITYLKAFEIDGLTKAPNTTRIILGENVSLAPSENWVARLSAGTVELSHSEGISGVLKIAKTREPLKSASYDKAFDGFFAGFPTADITYTDVFINDAPRGRMAAVSYILNGKPSEMVVLGVGNAGSVTLALFQYESGGTRRELVFNLLKTIAYGANPVRVEN
jgi:hypothetical protein